MYGRSEPPGQWSVYAEFTISHPGVGDPENIPQTRTEQNDNSVRMTYSWNSQGNTTSTSWVPTGNIPSETASNPSTYTENRPVFDASSGYGFQKGNLLFTSTPPPRRPSNLPSAGSRLNAQESSGYGSNLSPNSISSTASMQHQEGRKCRSTCNITLCASQYPSESCHHHCGRTQSLRCQTPSSRSDYKNTYYGCGDPWCHHIKASDDYSMGGRCSPVLEACEDSSSLHGRSSKATRSLSRELDSRKDVSVQTFQMVDKCTSPISRVDDASFGFDGKNSPKKSKKIRRRSLSSYHRKAEPIQGSNSPSSFTPDSLESGCNRMRRIVRSPKLKRIPHIKADKSEVSTTDDKSSGSKKPRTVHIDVYCTGTEAESDSTNTDHSDNDTPSTPQTVFESEQVKITHKRAEANEVPLVIQEDEGKDETSGRSFYLQKQLSQNKSESEDDASTSYPSKLSSYSTIRDFASSISSVPRSWTNYSMSSCAIPDPDYDSVANTSWKDNTFSDLESTLQSRSSIAGTESSLFVPRRLLNKNNSIDERPELLGKEGAKSPSGASLQQSDSFEYANSEDKLRIKRMESVWQNEKMKDERLKSVEHKKQEKMKEYMQRKLRRIAKKESKETDSDDSADSGEGWTFVKDIGDTGTIRRQSKDAPNEQKTSDIPKSENSNLKETKGPSEEVEKKKPILVDQGSLSDSSPSPSCRTPSSAALLQRLSLDPTLRAPFTLAPGLYTEQRNIAKKFGPVISAFKKPGHHIGPVRNPECSCAHCKSYYEGVGFRSRTRSLGDPPLRNWKDAFST